MTAWLLVLAIAAAIALAWYLFDDAAEIRHDRQDERRWREQRLDGRRP